MISLHKTEVFFFWLMILLEDTCHHDQLQEDETPLTSELESKPSFSKVERFAVEGRKDTQPFLDSISKVNPVPNITL